MSSLRAPFLPGLLALLPAVPALAQRQTIAPTATTPTTFAIVVDTTNYAALQAPLRAYRDAVEKDGLGTWILVDTWATPEAVRDALRELHAKQPPLEGAILIGAIPIPMLRGAQHLTTAFKMDEDRYPRPRSSVPSDRVYEDFDLVLQPLGQDDKNPLLHYRQLAPESPQTIHKAIYTARLFPPADGEAGQQALAACLQRFAQDRQPPELDRVLSLMGHGYVSESLVAWADDLATLAEQLPAVRRPGGALLALDHERGEELEGILLRELADPALDLALLRSHGDDDKEFLLGAPKLPGVAAQIEAVQRYARERLRQAREKKKPEADVQKDLVERLRLPPQWLEKAFDADVTRADAALAAKSELCADEVAAIACGAKVLDLDACFNGNFTARPWQAGAYLYGKGLTRAVVANAVNIAQDVWSDQHIGLLNLGERVGKWHQTRVHIESHLFGDPTFRFAPSATSAVAELQRALTKLPAGPEGETRLLDALQKADAAAVRLEALGQLAARRGEAFLRALPIAARDPAEMVRRVAICLMGDTGEAAFVAPLVHAMLRDPSERVAYRAREALGKYAADDVAKAFAAELAVLPTPLADPAATLRTAQTAGFLGEYRTEALDRNLPAKKRVSALRSFRLYRVHAMVPDLLAIARAADDDAAVRVTAIEALGWFVFSSQRESIGAALDTLAADAAAPEGVRAEAKKTSRRLKDGANDPLLP